MKQILSIFLFISFSLHAQIETGLQYVEQIDSLRLKNTLQALASDKFEGRGTGKGGSHLAVQYITEYFKKNGITPGKSSYLQNINAYRKEGAIKYFIANDYDFASAYSFDNKLLQDSIVRADEIVFAGYGIYDPAYNDFENLDVTDKVVMVVSGNGPRSKFGVRYDAAGKSFPDKNYIKSKKAKALFIIELNFDAMYPYNYSGIVFESKDDKDAILPEVRINELIANKLLADSNKTIKQLIYEIEEKGTPVSFPFNNPLVFRGNATYKKLDAENIVAFIEGNDLKDEYIVLCAHYDHLGMSKEDIYNGADDNASGVSGAMEIARILSKAKKEKNGPRRSVVILLPTAEEEGLYGSGYYVEHPIYPLDKTKACLNLDMIGRNGNEETMNDYVFVSYNEVSSKDIIDQINQLTPVFENDITIEYQSSNNYWSYFRSSDHYNFYLKSIPSVMFHAGEHADYHKFSDTSEKIDYHALYKRTKVAFVTLWQLAN